MLEHTEHQRAQLAGSIHNLVVKSTLELERQRDNYLKEIADTSAQLSHCYDQRMEQLTARAQVLQSTCEIITRRCQQEAKAAKDEFDIYRAHYEMGETIQTVGRSLTALARG